MSTYYLYQKGYSISLINKFYLKKVRILLTCFFQKIKVFSILLYLVSIVHILSEIPNQIMLFWTTFLKTFLSFFKNYILHFIRNSKFICSRKYRAFSLFLSFSYCGVYIRSFWDMSKLKKFPLNKKMRFCSVFYNLLG